MRPQVVGLGCLLSTPDEVAEDNARRPMSRLLAAMGGEPRRSKVDHSGLLDFVPDQGNTSSCVAQAVSSACYLAGQAQGRPIKRPSRRHLYDLARYARTPGSLVDSGSSAYAMCSAAVDHGIIAEERWPFDEAGINESPPFDTDIAGMDALGLDWWRANDDPEELAVALDRNQMPCIAIPVYRNFINWDTAEPYIATSGDFIGFHMLCLIGFEDDPSLGLILKALNSWGDRWCKGGLINIAASFVQAKAYDRMLLRSAPAPR
jgi:hypothetical protein